ncbi:MAG: hypothetical protein JXA25_19720 [Anaerolineales bacterium]|nr:hypothetical protein [Anaerolineales bacterium]
MQQKKLEEKNGRVIGSMDAGGGQRNEQRFSHGRETTYTPTPGQQLTRSEVRRYTWYALLAAMLIALVFAVTWILFGLFCTKIWFA